ncbi:MAG TPA: hypothetical protein VLI93_04995 [Acetobacteraceae bacterium]|nr:hypothetical protein [Acetobacteraceae bacterium]
MAEINQGRDGAAEARRYFDPAAEAKHRRTRSVLGYGLSIFPKILGKIDRILIDINQSLARSSFCPNYIVMFEFDMEKFQFVEPGSVMQCNRRAIDQVAHWHQDIIDKQCMRPGDKQVGVRHIWTES